MSQASLAAAAIVWPWAASAQPRPEEPVRFSYDAPAGCPTLSTLKARVRERTARGREAADQELARTFNVQLRAESPGFSGTIQFLDDAGGLASRRVHSEECDALVSSLALIAALALDAALREDAPFFRPQISQGGPSPVLAERHEPAVAPASNPSSRQVEPMLLSARLGAAAAYDSLMPAPVFGVLSQLDFRNHWTFRLAAHYAYAKIEVDRGRAISVGLLGLETSVCPLRKQAGNFALYPCLALDTGLLRARGVASDELTSIRSETLFWAALGTELRVAWEPRSAFWLEVRTALHFPLVAHKFRLETPTAPAFAIDRLTGLVGFSTGLRFW